MMQYRERPGNTVFMLAAVVLLILPSGKVFSEDGDTSGYAMEVAAPVNSADGWSADRLLEDAEEDVISGEFNAARKKIKKVLERDNGNKKARKMLAEVDQQEGINRSKEKKEGSSFFSWLFPSPKKAAPAEEKKPREEDLLKASGYEERAREDLAGEKFAEARANALEALKMSADKETMRGLLAEIDMAEGIFREEHGIPPDGTGGAPGRSLERYQEERQRYETRKKLEDLSVRKDLLAARADLAKGDHNSARRKAYAAWKKIPYDQEIAMLIADINKAGMSGMEEPQSDLYDEESLRSQKPDPEDDPLTRHEEGKSYPDLGPLLMENIRGFYAEDEFGSQYAYPTDDYSVDDCVEIALRSSQRLIFADEQVKLGETRIWELRRKLFPDVALKMEQSFGKIADSTTNAQEGGTRHYQGKKYMAEIKHTVFDGFGTYFEIRQAQSNLEIIKMERERIRNDIIEETKKAYYSLDKAMRSLEIQYGVLDRIKEIYGIVDSAHKKGLLPAVESLKVKGLYLQAEFQAVSSQRDVDLARLVLTQAMNIDPDRPVRIKPLEKPKEFLKIGLQNCYNLALANNPDLRIKEKTIEYYDFERKVAKSKGWPKIDFMGTFGKAVENYQPMRYQSDWEKTNPIRAHRDLEPEWYAGIKGSLPLWGNTFEYNYVKEQWATTVSAFRGTESSTSYFTLKLLDNLAYFTGVQESRVGFERSKYEYQKAKNDLGMQVKTAYFKYRKSLLQMDVASSQVEHQRMFVSVLEERRKFGEMDMSRLVEEYVKLSEHEYGTEHGYNDYYVAVMELNKAIGVMEYFHPWKVSSDERQKSAGDVAEQYLSLAREELERTRFGAARKLVRKAEAIDGSNIGVVALLEEIDKAEKSAKRDKRSGKR